METTIIIIIAVIAICILCSSSGVGLFFAMSTTDTTEKDTTKDTAKDTTKDTAKDTTKDTTTDTKTKDTVTDTKTDTTKTTTPEPIPASKPAVVTCTADGTWSINTPVNIGEQVSRACSTGGMQYAKCNADGSWSVGDCPINANPGEAISCTVNNPKGAGAIYRYDGDKKMRWYPNPDIAGQWDPNWVSGVNRKVECTGFTLGNDIEGVDFNGYNIIRSTDAGGNDITHLDNSSFASCKAECDKRSDCRGFNFSTNAWPKGNGTCWIKNNVSNKGPTGDWHLFEKISAAFFEHCDYGGTKWELGIGDYSWIGGIGIANDAISSVKVPSGLKVILFEHANYEGKSLTLTSDLTLFSWSRV